MTQPHPIIKDLEAAGYKFAFTSNRVLHFNVYCVAELTIEFTGATIARVVYRPGWCTFTRNMPIDEIVDWLKSTPHAAIKAAFEQNGFELCDLAGWAIAIDGSNEFTAIRNNPPGKFAFDKLKNMVKFICGNGPLMQLFAITRFIKSLWAFEYKDDWYVSKIDPRFRMSLTEQMGATDRHTGHMVIKLTVDLAGTMITREFARADTTKIRDCDAIKTLFTITELTKANAASNKWISEHIDEFSNYAAIKQALGAIHYEYCNSDEPGHEYFTSKLTKNAGSVHITISNKYDVMVCLGGGDDHEKSFPRKVDPAEIIAWILEIQPLYADLIAAHAKLHAGDDLEAVRAELEATKAKLAATQANLEQIRAAVE